MPHWYKASNNIAYWDKFSRPETKPRYDRGVLDTWWYDKDKAAKLPAAAASPDGEDEKPIASQSRLELIFGVAAAVALVAYALIRFRRRKT